MDQILNYLAGVLGVSPETFVLVLGIVVAVCNLVGRLIPDDATGALGVARKVAKVLGLYLSNRVKSGVSVNDAARAVAGATAITTRGPRGQFGSAKLRSPAIVAILAGIAALCLTGCTLAQIETTTAAVCQSVPLAQSALDSAVQTKRVAAVQRILDKINVTCPGVLTALDLSQAFRLGIKVN